jgi:hypothetical protein
MFLQRLTDAPDTVDAILRRQDIIPLRPAVLREATRIDSVSHDDIPRHPIPAKAVVHLYW